MKNLAFYVAENETLAGMWVGFSHKELSYEGCLRGWFEKEFSKPLSIEETKVPDDISPELSILPLHKLVCQSLKTLLF